eukprot:117541_1
MACFVCYFANYYLLPCSATNLFNKRITSTGYTLYLALSFPIAAKLCCKVLPQSKLRSVLLFVAYTVIQTKMNEYCGVDTFKNSTKDEQNKKKPFFERK